jgi:hypothetical protein
MAESSLRLIRKVAEYIPQENVHLLRRGLRGLYVLYNEKRRTGKYDVVYVGMTNFNRGGVRSRLMRHRTRKRDLWTHASIFAVWENVRDDEVTELEGLFRHIYRHDSKRGPAIGWGRALLYARNPCLGACTTSISRYPLSPDRPWWSLKLARRFYLRSTVVRRRQRLGGMLSFYDGAAA